MLQEKTAKTVSLKVWQRENAQYRIMRKMFKTGAIGIAPVKDWQD